MARLPGRSDDERRAENERGEREPPGPLEPASPLDRPNPLTLPSPPDGGEGLCLSPLPPGGRAGVRGGGARLSPQTLSVGQVLSIQVYVEVGSPLGQPGGAVMFRIGIVMMRLGSRIWNG